MTDVIVYATASRADAARALLAAACGATGITARLELYGSGSLYLRLGPRHGPPVPDIVLWFGPFAAAAASADGLLQAHQPAQLANVAAHDPGWTWTALDYSPIGVLGTPTVTSWQDLANVPRLALADPERSEVGLSILLSSLDRARQLDGDIERGWTWWQERAQAGLLLAEDEAGAISMVEAGAASHALTLSRGSSSPLTASGTSPAQALVGGSAAQAMSDASAQSSPASQWSPLAGLAPIPHAVALAAASRNIDAARRLLDWLTSESASVALDMSPWHASSNGLASLLQAAPALDVESARQQYTAIRRRWAQSGFGPSIGG